MKIFIKMSFYEMLKNVLLLTDMLSISIVHATIGAINNNIIMGSMIAEEGFLAWPRDQATF